MDRNYNGCLEFVFEREAGYVNDPKDPGGVTNLGITIAVLSAWRHKPATADDMKRLTRKEAGSIYRALYWHETRCEHLPDRIDLLIFDAAVNMGTLPALNLLRAQIGLPVQPKPRRHQRHHAGPTHSQQDQAEAHLLGVLSHLCVPAVIEGLAERRRHFYRSLKTFDHFGKGWLKRVDFAQALAMRLWVIGGTGIPASVGQKVSHHPRHRAATH